VLDRDGLLSRRNRTCWTLLVVLLIIGSLPVTAQSEAPLVSGGIVVIVLCTVFLIIATAASGWYFGNRAQRVPFLIGIASFSAACGIGIGTSSQAAFAGIVPALAAAYGGAIVCAVSIGGKHHPSAELLANGSAASGIPLMLGAYFGNIVIRPTIDYPDPHRLVAAILILVITIAVSRLVARDEHHIALPLTGGAFGAFIGLVTGLSPHPVVGYVVPAALALFAVVASYAFTASKEERTAIGGFLVSFGALLIVSLVLGSAVRLNLSWHAAPNVLFAFATLMAVTLAIGGALGSQRHETISGIGFASLGAGVGLCTGMSQTPVMHIVTPTLLALLGGLVFYLVIVEKEQRNVALRLMLAFGVIVLFGAYVGHALRQGDLRDNVERVQEAVDEAGADLTITPVETSDGSIVMASTILEAAEDCLQTALHLEGSRYISVVVLVAGPGFTATVTIEETADQAPPLYNAPLAEGVPVAVAGERLEIRWPADADREALTIHAWEEVPNRNGAWALEGDGEILALDDFVEVEGDACVLTYPHL